MSATQSRFTAGAVPVLNEKGMCASVWKVWFRMWARKHYILAKVKSSLGLRLGSIPTVLC